MDPDENGGEAAEGGEQRLGDYELDRLIARGGMGLVYRARQRSLRRWVAVKRVSGGALASPDFLKRFRTEAEAAAALDHPNIVPIYEVGEAEGQPFFSMKLLEGGTLVEKARGAAMPPREAVRVLVKIARAVHYAHQRGILHRDIKPNNILLDGAGEPFLTDFGLAKLIERESTLTHTIAMLGTPAYMSPEQARGEARVLTTAADVYGLGAVLYELLTSQPPFAGGVSIETVRMVLEKEPRRPSLLNAAVDRDLETICLKCLEKEPARRYGSAEALADDLERWLRGDPIRARPTTALEKLGKWIRRRPATAALVGVALVAILGMFAVSTYFTLRLVEERRRVEVEAEANRRGAVQLLVAEARREVEDGDYHGALLPLVEALRRDEGRPDREDVLRRRLGTLLRLGPILRHLWFHGGSVIHASLSPDGRRLATASMDRTANIWDLGSGDRVGSVLVHTSGVLQVVFSPDGQRLATQEDWVARLWVVTNGQPVGPGFPQYSTFYDPLVFSPDGTRLAVPGPRRVAVWPTDGGGTEVIRLPETGPTQGLGLDESGGRLVAGGIDGKARVWDLEGDRPVGGVLEHRAAVRGAFFLPGDRGVVTLADDRFLRVWDPATGALRREVQAHEADIMGWSWSRDGQWLATAGFDNAARIWDTTEAGPAVAVLPHAGAVATVNLAADGKSAATGSYDGTVRRWRWRGGQGHSIPPNLPHAAAVRVALPEPSGDGLVTASFQGDARLWRFASNGGASRQLMVRADPVLATFGADEKSVLVVTEDGIVQRWSARGDDGVNWTTQWPGGATAAALSPDGRQLGVGDARGNVALFRVGESVPHLSFAAHTSGVTRLRFDHRGVQVLSAGKDRTVGLWSATNGNPRFPRLSHAQNIAAVELSPDDRWLVTSTVDQDCQLWDAATGRPGPKLGERVSVVEQARFGADGRRVVVANWDSSNEPRAAVVWSPFEAGGHALRLRHRDGVLAVAFSPDGRYVATGGEDSLARVWNVTNGEPVTPFLPHRAFADTVEFSPDSRLLATASRDGVVRVWDVADGQTMTPPLAHGGPVVQLQFSADGRYVLTAALDRTVRLWDIGPIGWPVADLSGLAELLASHRLESGGNRAPLSIDEMRERWENLRSRHPEYFLPR